MAEQLQYVPRKVPPLEVKQQPKTHGAPRNKPEQAITLRAAGCSYRQIAARLGVTPSTAHGYVKREMVRQRTELAETNADRHDLDLRKHAWLERRLMQAAKKGDWQAAKLLLSSIQMRRGYRAPFSSNMSLDEIDALITADNAPPMGDLDNLTDEEINNLTDEELDAMRDPTVEECAREYAKIVRSRERS